VTSSLDARGAGPARNGVLTSAALLSAGQDHAAVALNHEAAERHLSDNGLHEPFAGSAQVGICSRACVHGMGIRCTHGHQMHAWASDARMGSWKSSLSNLD
jgi:hypothetical protein